MGLDPGDVRRELPELPRSMAKIDGLDVRVMFCEDLSDDPETARPFRGFFPG